MATPTGWDLYTQRVTYLGTTQKEQLLNTLQEKIKQDFDTASTVQDIIHYKYDSTTNKFIATPCHCRITSVRMATKGTYKKIKDDMKDIIFNDMNYPVRLGDIFEFSGFKWLVVETDNIMSATQDCIVQRMNAKINFYDNKGVLHNLDGYASNSIVSFQEKDLIILPKDQLRLIMRYDTESSLIRYSLIPQRFIINGNPWRIDSVIDNTSYVRNSEGYIEIRLVYDTISDYDDLENNIADRFKYETKQGYLLTLDNSNIGNVNIGSTLQLQPKLYLNGVLTSQPLTYTSSDNTIATVDTNGIITGITSGNCTITVSLTSDTTVNTTFNLQVNAVATNPDSPVLSVDIVSSNGLNTIGYSSIVTYTAIKKSNGNAVIPNGNFNFSINYNGLDSSVATLTIVNGQQCKIKANSYNKTGVGNPYKITLVAVDSVDSTTKTMDIILKSPMG